MLTISGTWSVVMSTLALMTSMGMDMTKVTATLSKIKVTKPFKGEFTVDVSPGKVLTVAIDLEP